MLMGDNYNKAKQSSLFGDENMDKFVDDGLLQQRINEVGCSVLNYINNRIEIDVFYSEEMYNKYLSGVDCKMGAGLYSENEKLNFNKLDDGKLVIVKKDGVEEVKYRYDTILKITLEYIDKDKKKKSKTLRIRKNKFNQDEINYMEFEGESRLFKSIMEIKKFMNEKFDKYKIIEWDLTI